MLKEISGFIFRIYVRRNIPDDAGKVTLGFRPENVVVSPTNEPNSIPVQIELVEELGSDAYAYGSIIGQNEETTTLQGGQLIARVDPRAVPSKGDTVYVVVRPDEQHIFSPATGERIEG